jgi:SNF2 family DNA or RNA helicase
MIKRQAAVELFQNNPDTTLIAGSFGPMGTGHTLTASSHVIIAELDWVPGVLLQAEDRCHRYPQNQCVLVQHLVLEDSLDVNMSQRAIEKQKAIELGLNLKTGTWEQNGTGASHSNGNGSALASAGNGAGNLEGTTGGSSDATQPSSNSV